MYLLRLFLILIFTIVAIAQSTIAQCAMCRATVENNVSYGEASLATGLNLGILYLFVAPYLVIGTIAFFWYKKSRATHAKKISRIRHS